MTPSETSPDRGWAAESFRIVATCHRGIAPYLTQEIAELGYAATEFQGGTALRGGWSDVWRLNWSLRCASQVLVSLATFRCPNPDQMYRQAKEIPWERLIPADGYFSVTSNVLTPTIRSDLFANLKLKDAIVDRIRLQTGRRPDSGAELKGAVVHLFWRQDRAEVFLDSSGPSLTRHGYRMLPGPAPLNEALACALLRATQWDRRSPLINPMCGSGTLAIEAALMAAGIPPGWSRNDYAFQHLKIYDREAAQSAFRQLRDQVDLQRIPLIRASDHDPEVLEIARANAAEAGIEEHIEFQLRDFAETPVPQPGPGVILLNPEYGERLGDPEELKGTYRRIGDYFKQKGAGYWGFVFTSNPDLAKFIGLKPKVRGDFSTAQLAAKLYAFEIYSGTRRQRGLLSGDPDAESDSPRDSSAAEATAHHEPPSAPEPPSTPGS